MQENSMKALKKETQQQQTSLLPSTDADDETKGIYLSLLFD